MAPPSKRLALRFARDPRCVRDIPRRAEKVPLVVCYGSSSTTQVAQLPPRADRRLDFAPPIGTLIVGHVISTAIIRMWLPGRGQPSESAAGDSRVRSSLLAARGASASGSTGAICGSPAWRNESTQIPPMNPLSHGPASNLFAIRRVLSVCQRGPTACGSKKADACLCARTIVRERVRVTAVHRLSPANRSNELSTNW
jgi:hypothetical protein